MLKYVISALYILCNISFAAVEKIDLDNKGLPASDLIHPDYGEINSEQARKLKMQGLDLSNLEPSESAIWKNDATYEAQKRAENSIVNEFGSIVEFKGAMTSQENTLMFSAIHSVNSSRLVVMMDISLHANLLRKSLLRKLGYIVPSMKYVKNLTIRFETPEQLKEFVDVTIPHNTSGHSDRWVSNYDKNENSFELKIHDAVVMMPKEEDHLNLALNVPPRRLGNRVQRVMSLVYALTNVSESINKLSWKVGNIDNNEVRLSHHGISTMGTTYSDAIWLLDKLSEFKRIDFEEIVADANLPQSVSMLLIEKLISRRNHLMNLFSYETNEISYNNRPSFGSELKDGVLVEKKWNGYASRFAYGEPDSPFKDLHLYAFLEIKSEVIDNLVSIANKELEFIDISEERFEYFKKDFQKGLDHYLKTGEFLEKEVGTWVSPTVNGNLILSRSTVIGNNGTNDNLIQLADTIGYSVSLGAHLGVEGLETGWGASAKANLQYLKTYTHLKPISSLKEAVKEDHVNMIVPFFKYTLSKKLDRLENVDQESPKAQEEITEIVDLVSKQMGVGESLVITSKITPKALANVGYSVSGTTQTLNTGVKAYYNKKWHIYKKSADEYQIYLDKGKGVEWSINYSLKYYIPVIRAAYTSNNGKYNVEMFSLNLNPKLSKNKDLFKNAMALSSLLKNGSKELLKKDHESVKDSNDFYDESFKFSFLLWKKKHLEQEDDFFIEDKKGRESNIIRHSSKDLFGTNYRNFLTEVANYYVQKNWEDITLGSNPWKHPGKTEGGKAKVAVYNYEAIKRDGKLINPFISISELQEGWSIKRKKLKKALKDLNERYSGSVFELFSNQDVDDATDLKLYRIKVAMNIYTKGVERILNKDLLKNIEKEYKRKRPYSMCEDKKPSGLAAQVKCGNFHTFFWKMKSCKKKFAKKKYDDASECMAEYAKKLKKYLEFEDLINLVGQNNYYIYASVDGFRKDSEVLNDTIKSNTHGRVDRRFPNGPVEFAREKLGMQSAEFFGSWLREAL